MDNLGNISHWPSHSLCAEKEENDGLSFGIYIYIHKALSMALTAISFHHSYSPTQIISSLLLLSITCYGLFQISGPHPHSGHFWWLQFATKKIMIIKMKPPFSFFSLGPFHLPPTPRKSINTGSTTTIPSEILPTPFSSLTDDDPSLPIIWWSHAFGIWQWEL